MMLEHARIFDFKHSEAQYLESQVPELDAKNLDRRIELNDYRFLIKR